MAETPITELDFFSIKTQLKDYLKNQNKFKDYDFEGSNMSVLLDVLAYNTYQNNFYTNMAISEMFLDSAQLKNSVVSHAKELNYLPRSAVSAKATVTVSFSDNTPSSSVLIPKNTRFTSAVNGSNFTFITNQSYLARRTSGNTFVAENVNIYEGILFSDFEKEGFFLDETELKCVLMNDNVDLESISVSANDKKEIYSYRKDIFGVQPSDLVYYIEPYFDDRYSVVFGKNKFGKQPTVNDTLNIEYRVTNGSRGNGISKFSTSFKPNTTVFTVSPALGGADPESIESIKFFAPKSIQIQERAVTERDYEILLKQRFTDIKSISVYGGDELDPPKYGRVGISINLESGAALSNTRKSEFIRYLSDKTPIAIEPIFIDPLFMKAKLIVSANYSKKYSTKSSHELELLIREAISNYNNSNLEEFGSILRISKLSTILDATDISIMSNSIDAIPFIEYSPALNTLANPTFNFESKLIKPYPFKQTSGFVDFKPSIYSSSFIYKGIRSILQDDGSGNMRIVSADASNPSVLTSIIGSVDYSKGAVNLVGFITEGYTGAAIKIYAVTEEEDIVSPKNRVFSVYDEDVYVTLTEEK